MKNLLKMTDFKRFDLFVFLSNLAIGMIEVYIPVLLYLKGYTFREILLYFVIKYTVGFLISERVVRFGNKIGFKKLLIISTFFFAGTYSLLFHFEFSLFNLFLIGAMISCYSELYWSSRRYFQHFVLPPKDIADEIGIILIFNEVAGIIAAFTGAYIMSTLGNNILLIIVVIIMFLSLIPLLHVKDRKPNRKILGMKLLPSIPRTSLMFIGARKFYSMTMHLFPLYLFLFIDASLTYIGLFNAIVGVASIIFIYFFSHKIDKDKNDYLIFSSLFLGLVLVGRLSVLHGSLMLLLGLLEGIFKKMFEVSNERNECALGKHYDILSYIIIINYIENGIQLLFYLLCFLFLKDLQIILMILVVLTMGIGLIKFDDGKGGY